MPLAVTTQGETLWLGLTRSSMVRVPHVVSSPEIAPEPQRIDATNLASDRMVYVRGIKDYAGELAWEANAQRYRAGELRDLMAMDGQRVYVERRMPLVGVRVSFEGTATIAMSSASPDSVQHVTIKVAPSSSMAVEEWDSSMSDGWTVRIRTDADTHMDVVHVAVGYGGRSLTQVMNRASRQQGASSIVSAWEWNGGMGPFGCFYGAFNIDAYSSGTESEEPICTEAGRLAYRLDPYDLRRTIGGTTLAGAYNVLLVIPTVYWKVSGNDLYMTSKAASGYTAYAHTAVSGGETIVYPYIGIGVYEAYSDGTRLLSIPGVTPTGYRTHDQFKALADALVSAGTSDFQQWNLYQWTLFKMMAYAVMGTKNSQWMLGDGPTNMGSSGYVSTGMSERAGPYADSTSQYDKIFIENSWGNVYSFVGDTMVDNYSLYAGQTLGGAEIGSQPSTGATLPSTSTWVWVKSLSNAAATWDIPSDTQTSSNENDPAAQGDKVTVSAGQRILLTGGDKGFGHSAGIGCIMGSRDAITASAFMGTRLSAFLDDYALGGDAE